MYEGMSDCFRRPTDPVPLPDAAHGIDFEGEFGVLVDAEPMGTSAAAAMSHIRLLVQINDCSLRCLAPAEMKISFGFIQAKPACSMAPFAVTPDALGEHWSDGRVFLELTIDWNGRRVGGANGREMAFCFHELLAHAAATRHLAAGTVIGCETAANVDYTIQRWEAEKRMLELEPRGFLSDVHPLLTADESGRFDDAAGIRAYCAVFEAFIGKTWKTTPSLLKKQRLDIKGYPS
jgi:2-keto-4-pentenoate hydratase/2-oxohepta-3-ene-1,7-dioic acid hydratase in catechol pathway